MKKMYTILDIDGRLITSEIFESYIDASLRGKRLIDNGYNEIVIREMAVVPC